MRTTLNGFRSFMQGPRISALRWINRTAWAPLLVCQLAGVVRARRTASERPRKGLLEGVHLSRWLRELKSMIQFMAGGRSGRGVCPAVSWGWLPRHLRVVVTNGRASASHVSTVCSQVRAGLAPLHKARAVKGQWAGRRQKMSAVSTVAAIATAIVVAANTANVVQ